MKYISWVVQRVGADRKPVNIPGATVYVYLSGTNTLAPGVVNASGVPQNPLTADENGQVIIGAPGPEVGATGRYDLAAVPPGGGTEVRLTTVQFADEVELAQQVAADRAVVANLASQTSVDAQRAEAAASAASQPISDAFPTIADGRAAVSDNEVFLVEPNDTDNLTRYSWFRRLSSSTEELVFVAATESDVIGVQELLDSRIAPQPFRGAWIVGADGFRQFGVTPDKIHHPAFYALSASVGGAYEAAASARLQSMPVVTNIRGLDRFFSKLGDADHAPVRIICPGDSTTYGQWVDGTETTNDADADALTWAARLRNRFAREFGVPVGNSISGLDTRLVLSGSPTANPSVGLMRRSLRLNGSGQSGRWDLPAGTRVTIAWYENNGADGGATTGSFKYTIDGGAPVTVSNAGGANTYRRVTVSGLAEGPHQVLIEWVSGENYICSVGHDSGSGVVVGRFGRNGWTSYDALGKGVSANNALNAAGRARMLAAFGQQEAPDLLIWNLGRNDCTFQATAQADGDYPTPAGYKANTQAVIDEVTAAGGCVLLLSSPAPNDDTSPGAEGYYYRDFWAVNDELAAENRNVAAFRMVDAIGNYSMQTEHELLDHAHPNRRGHGVWSRVIWSILMRVAASY